MKNLKQRTAIAGTATLMGVVMSISTPALATSDSMGASGSMMATGLVLPSMNAANGRLLYASKGCVVCHSINGVGGEDAPMLDAEFMDEPMNPFDFAANMWRGAETMVEMQREELGDVIDISGQELADIIAFVHDPDEQALFTGEEIPADMKALMEHADTEAEDAHD